MTNQPNMMYWAKTGSHQALYDLLANKIPNFGECAPEFPKLERLRKAANCYYDLYNNGLCNRATEFRKIFGFGGMTIVRARFTDYEFKMTVLEAKMDKIIMAAAKEAGLLTE